MVRVGRSSATRSASLRFVLSRVAALIILSSVAITASITEAHTPPAVLPSELLSAEIPAALQFDGEKALLTGSVTGLFAHNVFTGPNRAAKQDRLLPPPDPLAVASAFDAIRAELAAKRPKAASPDLPNLTDFVRKSRRQDDLPMPIALAAVDPGLLSAALTAIDKALPVEPIPFDVPETLAYARANTPAKVFGTPVSMQVTSKQFECLATAIYFEARGESYRGQAAVAQVVLNRVKHDLYPTTICSVVYQNQTWRNACQFSFACDGIPERITEPEAWAQAREIAQKVLEGEIYLTEVANATHYHATYVSPRWAPRMRQMAHIGLHKFYRFKT